VGTVDKFAIFVTIKLKPGMGKAFRPLILENAEAAVRDEKECLQFQVMTAEGDPDTYFFYEVYTEAAALDRHRETPHYKKYMAAASPMMAERSIQRCTLIKE
jgi:(4S)-4-hydroxy-5-phosphonooxypentane-2,3-dione isomerase